MAPDHIDIGGRGEEVTLPLVDILTGRGFVTGKSGSGKSTSVNVIVEEILDLNQPLLIVDTDGEYWGLKEHYRILHLGNDDRCDVRVTSTDAETIVDLALVEKVPIVLDISGFLHTEDAEEVLQRVVRELFHREKTLKEPFLLIVEEVHEYIPETGALTDVGETLIQVAKRGRKHGLGFCGVSQRPASVDKDFITQCDWMVWHRLTWKNDTEVVRTILGSDASDTIQELEPGEAMLMTDWDERVRQVQFRQKRTFDAGATPGFEEFQPPELVPVDPAVLNRFDARRQNVDYAEMDDAADAERTDGETGDDPSEASATGSEAGESEADPSAGETVESQTADDERDDEPGGAEEADTADAGVATETDAVTETQPTAEADAAPTPEPAPPAPTDDETVVDAQVVARERSPDPPTPRTAERAPRRSKPRRAATTPPTTTSEGVAVEFAQLVLFLAGWIRARVARGIARGADAVGRAADRVGDRTGVAGDDVVVAGWIALVVLLVLGLSLAFVAVL